MTFELNPNNIECIILDLSSIKEEIRVKFVRGREKSAPMEKFVFDSQQMIYLNFLAREIIIV